MASVELKNVAKSFGKVEAVRDVSLVIEDREFVVFVGPSGCGKSTLLRMIAGLEEITAGELLIGGKPMNAVAAADRGIAMVFQSYALYPHMTVAENMGFALKMLGTARPRSTARSRKRPACCSSTSCSTASRRSFRAGSASASPSAGPSCASPTSSCSTSRSPISTPASGADARRDRPAARAAQTTMIYVTHDQVEAMTLADRIVILNKGRIEQQGSPLELYEKPANRFVAGFLGQPRMNFIPTTVRPSEAGPVLALAMSGHEILRSEKDIPMPAAVPAGAWRAPGFRFRLSAQGRTMRFLPSRRRASWGLQPALCGDGRPG